MLSEYKEYYIAFIDILGFKNLISKKSCEEIINIYESIKKFRTIHEQSEEEGKKISKPIISQEKVHIRIMSDSVCIYIPTDEPNSLFLLSFMCLDFQSRMFEMNPPILLRGAITKGLLYSNGDLLFGPGFVEAYLMEENNAVVPRIIINKSVIDEYKGDFVDTIAIRDFDAFYYLNYISFYGLNNRENIGKYKKLYERISEILNTTTDSSVRNKYLYLESKILPLIEKE